MLLAQITDTAHKLADTAKNLPHVAGQGEELRFGDLLIKGGWVMVPIGVFGRIGPGDIF